MTAPTPPPAPAGRGISRAGLFGIPWWAVAVAVGAGIGGYMLIRRSQAKKAAASSGTSTDQGVTNVTVPSDQQIGLTQYEQISAELVGIEGTEAALLAAIKDMQGDESKEGDTDTDHDCPRGRHWDESKKRCVKNRGDDNDRDNDNDRDDVRVPDVEGETRSESSRRIRRAGLRPEYAPGFFRVVTLERPPAGQRVERGSTVRLAGRRPAPAGK